MPRYHQGALVSCEIPWDEQENLLEDVFREEVRGAIAHGFRNVYVFGTAGEGDAVDTARFRRVVDIFWEETRGDGAHAGVGVIACARAAVLEPLAFAVQSGLRV